MTTNYRTRAAIVDTHEQLLTQQYRPLSWGELAFYLIAALCLAGAF